MDAVRSAETIGPPQKLIGLPHSAIWQDALPEWQGTAPGPSVVPQERCRTCADSQQHSSRDGEG